MITKRNKEIIFLIMLIYSVFINSSAYAQNDSIPFNRKAISKNVVYFELIGNGFTFLSFMTVNYERTIVTLPKLSIALRGGVFYNNISKIREFYSVPILLNIMTKPMSRKHLESGLGITITNEFSTKYPEKKDIISYGITANVKYRYQKVGKGFYFAVGLTPTYFFPDYLYKISEFIHLISGGVCIGYHF